MKLLLIVSVCCIIVYTFAQPLEKKSESQNVTKLEVKTDKAGEQKKKDSVKAVESTRENQAEKSNLVKANPTKKGELMKRAESVYQSLPMPFIHYPFPFVNSYTSRYFPYGYAGLGYDNVLGYGGLGYNGLGYGGLGYAYGYGGWF